MKFATLLIVVVSAAKWVVSAPLAKEDNTVLVPDVGACAAKDLIVADIAIDLEWYYKIAPPNAETHGATEDHAVDGVATRPGWYYNARQVEPRNVEARSAAEDFTVDGASTRSGWSYPAHRIKRRDVETRSATEEPTEVDE